MSNKLYINARYGFREDSLENWETINPVLERGEPSIVRDGKDGKWLKIGDGVTPWNDLPYKLGPVGPQGPQGDPGVAGKDAVTDQTYSPPSPNAQSGVAIEERLKSKVVLDVTLTEEQAGVNSVMVEIPDRETLAKAKQIHLHCRFQAEEAKALNAVWINAMIQNQHATAYSVALNAGYNHAWTAGQWVEIVSTAVIYDFDENGGHALKSMQTFIQPTGPWRGFNSRGVLYSMANAYPCNFIAQLQYKPYLKLSSEHITFPVGTRLYMEVLL